MRVCMYIYYRLIRCVKNIIYLIYLLSIYPYQSDIDKMFLFCCWKEI